MFASKQGDGNPNLVRKNLLSPEKSIIFYNQKKKEENHTRLFALGSHPIFFAVVVAVLKLSLKLRKILIYKADSCTKLSNRETLK